MQRRTLLKLGLAGGVALAAGAGVVALVQPAREGPRLTTSARAFYAAVARGVLGPLIPDEPVAQAALLDAHLLRLEQAIAGMPPSVQREIDELSTLAASAPGRLALIGLTTPWDRATAGEVQSALQALRHSRIALRQQVYQALRELTNAAFFADPATWALMGYEGQRPVPNIPPA